MTPSAHGHRHQLKGLYAITDQHLISAGNFAAAVEQPLQGGASIIQYRDKSDDRNKRLQQAKSLRSLCDQYHATCIINDDIELAVAVNADGVHIGKDDTALKTARETLGKDAIIGVSCYNDLSLALEAQENSADYVAFGAMFSSSTKPAAMVSGPEVIANAKQALSIPVCTIGGITEDNIQQVVSAGTDMAAIINDLFAADDIKAKATRLSDFFK